MSGPITQTLTAEAARELQAFVNTTDHTDAQIVTRIESLSVSADVKGMLGEMLRLSTAVGEVVLRVGRKILDFVLTMLRHFPALGAVVIIASVVTLLVSLVPFIGGILASVLGPLLIALGVTGGAALEVQDRDFRKRVSDFAAGFRASVA